MVWGLPLASKYLSTHGTDIPNPWALPCHVATDRHFAKLTMKVIWIEGVLPLTG